MSGSIARSVRQIKADLGSIVAASEIVKLCEAAGHVWRDRTLGPVETIYLFIAQVLHGNTSCAHVRQFGGFAFARSAYCQARQRLPAQILRDLLRATGQRVTEQASRVGFWRGHRVVSVDGSTFSMSDSKELQGLFRWAPGNRGHELPLSRFVALFDLITGSGHRLFGLHTSQVDVLCSHTNGHTGAIKRHIPAAQHQDAFPNSYLFTQIQIPEEIKPHQHIVQISTWNGELLAHVSADRNQNGIVAFIKHQHVQ